MTIVLIPGLMNDGGVWRHQLGPLSRRAPVFVAHNDGLDSLAGMAHRILATTDGPLALVGHSMGGRVALEIVATAPDRVTKLVLMATGAGGRGQGEETKRLPLVEMARQSGMAAVADAWLPPMLGPSARRDGAVVEEIRAMLLRCTAEDFARQQRALLERHDRTALLPTIAAPTLVIGGGDDSWNPPATQQALAAPIPIAQTAIVAGSGHMLPLEAPEAVTELLVDFLA